MKRAGGKAVRTNQERAAAFQLFTADACCPRPDIHRDDCPLPDEQRELVQRIPARNPGVWGKRVARPEVNPGSFRRKVEDHRTGTGRSNGFRKDIVAHLVAFLTERNILQERTSVQMRVDNRREQIRHQFIVQYHAKAVDILHILSVKPGQMVGKRSVFPAIDHGGRHAAELGIADKFLLAGTPHEEARHFTGRRGISAQSRPVDIVDLQLQAAPVSREIAAPSQIHLVRTGKIASLMGIRTRNDDSFRIPGRGIVVHGIVIIRAKLGIAHRSLAGLEIVSEPKLALIDLPSVYSVNKYFVQLRMPPFHGLRVGKVDVNAVSLPPFVRFAAIYSQFVAAHIVVSLALLQRSVLSFLVHHAGQPQDDLYILPLEVGKHPFRVGIPRFVPVEVIVGSRPRTVDDGSFHRNAP